MDSIIGFLVRKKHFEDPNLPSSKLVTFDFKFISNSSKKLVVILYPWRSKSIWFFFLKKYFSRKGYSYLCCSFAPQILSNNPQNTDTYFKEIKNLITLEINRCKQQYGFTDVTLVGISLSVVIGLMVSNGNQDINSIVSVTFGDDLAEALWVGSRTQGFREEYEKRGYTLEKLKEEWKDLAPVNNINDLEGKKLKVLLSKADRVIPSYLGERLIKEIQDKGLYIDIHRNTWLGHYGTILGFSLFFL